MSGVLSDVEITELAKAGMIEPFFSRNVCDDGKISYGLSSYGYDISLAYEYKIFDNRTGGIVDPKNFDKNCVMDFQGNVCLIPPHGFVLARSAEYMKIPRDIITICLGKSTYARCGIIVNITALEPEWEGHVTIEISNTTPFPVKVYSGEGIAQVLFFRGERYCENTYKDKGGKYQGQTGITLAK
jgi:dCTP deaminase